MTGDEGALERAQRQLHELARLLRRVPVGDATRDLHLRALRLKREIEDLRGLQPGERTLAPLLRAIEEVQGEAAMWTHAPAAPPDDRRSTRERWLPHLRRLAHEDGTT